MWARSPGSEGGKRGRDPQGSKVCSVFYLGLVLSLSLIHRLTWSHFFCRLNTCLLVFQNVPLGCAVPPCLPFWHIPGAETQEPTVWASQVCLVALGEEDGHWVTWPLCISELVKEDEKTGNGCHKGQLSPISSISSPCCLIWKM